MKIQFIAQMVEHRSANAEAMCVQNPKFFSGLLKTWLTKVPNNI